MEQIYALGIICIQYVQEWFRDYAAYFELINNISNPMHISEVFFPLVSIVDSVFASQLILCISFGGWLNTVLKWWLLEDRPYWWVRETTFYLDDERPTLLQTHQTCETGMGSPSGHTTAMALLLTLIVMYCAHIANDRHWTIPWWVHKLTYPLYGAILLSVMLARMYVAAHFPHQCMLGALVGVFICPLMCLCVSDPFIWQYGRRGAESRAVCYHVLGALATAGGAALTYLGLKLCHIDPHYTVKLAFRWCMYPENISVSTTPMFAIVQTTAYLLGAALAISPEVAKYRHDTKNRSLLISAFSTALIVYMYRHIDENLCKSNTLRYYVSQYIMFAIKPMLLLRLVPALSMWPYSAKCKVE